MKRVFAASFIATQQGVPFSSNEHRILLYMAAIAHDDDRPPRYWGGREALAEVALSRRLPSPEVDPKGRNSILKSVSIATRGLVTRGAIRLLGGAHPGRRQEYELTVENVLPAEWAREPDVPPLGTSGSTIGNVRFHLWESDVPPKDQEHQQHQDDTTTQLPKVSSLAHSEPVDNERAAS